MRFGDHEILARDEIEGGGFDALARDGDGREVRLWAGAPGSGAAGETDVAAARGALARVHQASIPRVLGSEVTEGRAVLLVQAYRGERLDRRLERGPLPPTEALDVCRGIAAGLVKAHRAGIVHGAVGPAEILLAEDGRTLLLHAGLAPFLGPRRPRAPEDLDAGAPTESGDVFGLSRTLVHCLTGRDPLARAGAAEEAEALRAGHRPGEGDFPASLPEGLRRLLARAVRTDREGRIHRAEELAGDLGVIRASWDSLARRPRRALPLPSPRIVLAAGAAAVVLVALGLRSCGS